MTPFPAADRAAGTAGVQHQPDRPPVKEPPEPRPPVKEPPDDHPEKKPPPPDAPPVKEPPEPPREPPGKRRLHPRGGSR